MVKKELQKKNYQTAQYLQKIYRWCQLGKNIRWSECQNGSMFCRKLCSSKVRYNKIKKTKQNKNKML